MPFVYDQTIFLLIITILFAFWSKVRIKKTYAKYTKIKSVSGYSGEQIATKILQQNGIYDVNVISVEGKLSDHYDLLSNTVKLSQENYKSKSLAAIVIAAHEAGHVLQYKNSYIPLMIKSIVLPLTNMFSYAAFTFFSIGLFMSSLLFMKLGILFFCTVVLFYLVTLTVELNASNRALFFLKSNGYLSERELNSGKKVLNAAALTYVAAAATILINLIKVVIIKNSE